MDPTMAPTRKQSAHAKAPRNALERAAQEAQRALLRETLEASGWSLSECARRLGMVGPSGIPQSASVLRALRRLGLAAEYGANKPA